MNKSCLSSSNPMHLEGPILDLLYRLPKFPRACDFFLQAPIYPILGFYEPSICNPALDLAQDVKQKVKTSYNHPYFTKENAAKHCILISQTI